MRSLFLKIFLWFWLATAIVGAAYIFSISVTQSEPVVVRWREITANALSLYAHAAVEAFDREGASRVENYFEQLERETGIRAALFDEKGEKLCGESFTGAAEMAEKAASTGEPEFRFSGPFTVTARSVKGLDGKRYVIVAEVARTRFGIFRAEPEAWALRILAVLIASGIVCYWLARYLTSPVVRLRDATRQLASGDLSARVGPSARRDELANLGRDFDTMAERIESLIEAQRRLLGDISHELRSPLARLSVALGLARRQAGEQAAPSLDRIEREAERLNDLIMARAFAWSVAFVAPAEIDTLNIHRASLEAMRRAVLALSPLPDAVLVDAFRIPEINIAQRGVLHGDRRCAAIAAASIVAKVSRDRQMMTEHASDPRYGYDKHKGYATAEHRAAVERFGYSSLHRRSFKPQAGLFDRID